jgi:NADPH2:quinone reductase
VLIYSLFEGFDEQDKGGGTMRAAWYERNGTAREVLVVGEMPAVEPGPGEVRVALKASGVNPSDVKARGGSRPMLASRIIPHSDGAGVIEKVGSGASADRVGQRVWVWNGQWKRPLGTCAQLITLPAEQATAMPEPLAFEEGACLGIPALTAYRALATDGGVLGQIVLVAGGAGAVGHYAVQMAKLMGAAKVIATVSTPAKAAHARTAGADEVIDYKTEAVAERIKALTGGHGVDRVVEVDIAGNASLYPAIMARDGMIAAYGSNSQDIKLLFSPLILTGAAIRFFIVYELAPEARSETIEQLARWIGTGRLQHAVAARYPLDRIVDAHEAVERGTPIGNVVVTL